MRTAISIAGAPPKSFKKRTTHLTFDANGRSYSESSWPIAESVLHEHHPTWKVSHTELWYFDDNGLLTSLNSENSGRPVSTEQWRPKESICVGELSVLGPRRFLAACVGAHFCTDQDLDGVFGYSRIALFDVESRHILARIDGPAYTSAALSPLGKQISVLHGSKIHLYHVN